jgi:hypothetical protein
MAAGKEDLFEDDDEFDQAQEEYERLRDLLQARIAEFADEHEIPVGALSPLLLDLAVTTRMTDYALSVEKPSASGLKLDLDRMLREAGDFVRDCKRHADEFIAHTKDAIAQAQAEIDADDEGGHEPENSPGKH